MAAVPTPGAPDSVALGLFVKEPTPGRVKTRLAPALGAAGAAELYRAFVVDTLTLALNSPAGHCRIFHAGAPPSLWIDDEWPSNRVTEAAQSGADLGARLDDAFRLGPTPMLILGSDSPDLPPAHLRSALQALADGAEVVLGDAGDGGVWCIGLDRHRPGFFGSIPWSTPQTGDALRNRADQTGLKRVEVAPWYDCDLPEDLRALAARLRQQATGANMTRHWLHHSHPDHDPDST